MVKICPICKIGLRNQSALNKHYKLNHIYCTQISPKINKLKTNKLKTNSIADCENIIFQYVKEHIDKHWTNLIKYIYKSITLENTEFGMFHIKTNPESHLSSDTQKNLLQWTFCFIKLKEYPNALYMLFSNSPEGVFKRLCINNEYLVSSYTTCVYGTNEIKDQCGMYCLVENFEPNYIYVNWYDEKSFLLY